MTFKKFFDPQFSAAIALVVSIHDQSNP